MHWKEEYQEKLRTAGEAVKLVKDGDVVWYGGVSSIAYKLAEALYERKDELNDVKLCGGLVSKVMPQYTEDAKGHFSTMTFFPGAADRYAMKYGMSQYTSVHLSQVDIWCRETAKPNVAFFTVSPPDEDGNFSYGSFGAAVHECIKEGAETIVLQVNRHQPYVYGQNNLINISEATAIVEIDDEPDSLYDIDINDIDEATKAISRFILSEIPDGATIQLGLGNISTAVGYALRERNDLGVHSELMADVMMELARMGVITNKNKTFMPGKMVAAFALGSKRLYEYLNYNKNTYFGPFTFVNDPVVIAKNNAMMSVNTAMSIDLFGQVCSDCMEGKQYSATGGQVDFVRGAQMSPGGKSFIAISSTLMKKGELSSRIVPCFPRGTVVTTPRSDVQYIVTEYGCVNLKPLTMSDRARAIISLAHPSFRDELTDAAKEMGLIC